MTPQTHIFPYLLAGGLGTRLGSLSSPEKPKQFLPLLSERSMIDETLSRLDGAHYQPPTIIANSAHGARLKKYPNLILEKERKGTAVAIKVAAEDAITKDQNAQILILPCDHYIAEPSKLHDAVLSASAHRLSVFGIRPHSPETGYGYIQQGAPVDKNTRAVMAFKEKPDAKTAKEYLEQGDYFWNSGVFLFNAQTILKEIETLAPDIENQKKSIDFAVLEKSKHLHMVELKTYWRDIGTIKVLNEVKARISA